MKIVIDIPEEDYKWITENPQCYTSKIDEAVRNGTTLENFCSDCEFGNPCLYCKHEFKERGEQNEDSN